MIKDFTQEEIDYLLSPKAIRDRAKKLFDLALEGKTHFNVHLSKLDEVSSFVLDVIKENYPSFKIPFHSRWGHFKVGDIDRLIPFNKNISSFDKAEQARIKIDLVVTSVLLDAGAGAKWSYKEPSSNKNFSRSEGLAVASFDMFRTGAFSLSTSLPFRADGKKLAQFSAKNLEEGFQVSSENPLEGLEGRASLISALGDCLLGREDFFKDGRPGNLYDYLIKTHGKMIKAPELLKAVLLGFGKIWPGRISLGETNLGDVWHHPLLGEKESTEGLIPFHKLSQWLTYSLIEPLEDAGLIITHTNELTGLAEYRNGGLLLDSGLIELQDQSLAKTEHLPGSQLIIEWRALTIVLLDKIAERVRRELGKSSEEFPLGKVLEGGTWWAGRRLAKQKREDSSPPLKLKSDGTVF